MLNITIPPTYRALEGSILIDNLITNQTEVLFLTYDPVSDSELPKPSPSPIHKYSNFSYSDYFFMTLVIILITLLYFYSKNSSEPNNTRGNIGNPQMNYRPFEPAKRGDDSFMRNLKPFVGNEQFGTPPDVLRTPLDKRKNLIGSIPIINFKNDLLESIPENLQIYSNNKVQEYSFHRNINS